MSTSTSTLAPAPSRKLLSPSSSTPTPTQKLILPSSSTSSSHLLSPPATPTILTEFHLFPKLPLEIRLRIYTLSLPGPRLIPLVYIPPSITSASSHPPKQRPHQNEQQQQNTPKNLPPPTIPHLTPFISPSPSSASSSASLPSLLHTTHESRTHIQTLYLPRLPLCGLSPSHNQTQTPYRPTHDILYFPSLPLAPSYPFSTSKSVHNSNHPGLNTLNASFTNFSTICTLATPISLTFVQRLAVSEDVFLEVEKSRWGRERHRAMMDLGGLVFGESEKGGGMVGATRGRTGKGGIDAITLSNLSEFWDVVRRKFWGLEEVWIVGEGMEERVLKGDMYVCEEGSWGRGFDERGCERRGGDGYGDRNGMTRQRRISFRAKIERAVSRLEEETGWTAPRWRYLGCEDQEEAFSHSRFEFLKAQGYLAAKGPVHKSRHISDENAVVQKYDPKPEVEGRHC